MKIILLFARDPGSANVILPVYQKLKIKYHTLLYAKEFAYKIFRNAGLPAKDICTCRVETDEDILLFLKEMHPDAVITGTSLDDFTERYLWKAANILHIKSFAILDQWVNLGIRFSNYNYTQENSYWNHKTHPYLPYRILVMDEIAKIQLIKEGIQEEIIVPTGHPHFDTVLNRFKHAKPVYNKEQKNIVFVSEPISQDYDNCDDTNLYWGYNERTIFHVLYHHLETLAESHSLRFRFIIRPHPRESKDNWNQILQKEKNSKISLEIDRDHDSFSIMKSADLICGMSSMFLLESFLCGKAILSIEIGLIRKNPFFLDELNYCKSILSEEELADHLTRIFLSDNFELSQHTIKNGLPKIGYPEGVQNATEKIEQLIEEELA